MRIAVRAPASSANLGPGFDALGLALDLWNEIEVDTEGPPGRITIEGRDAALLRADASTGERENLVLTAMRTLAEAHGRALPPLALTLRNAVPVARGLGSSAAALVAGLLAADRLLGLDLADAVRYGHAWRMEGHGDNVGAAHYGGAVLAVPGVAEAVRLWPTAGAIHPTGGEPHGGLPAGGPANGRPSPNGSPHAVSAPAANAGATGPASSAGSASDGVSTHATAGPAVGQAAAATATESAATTTDAAATKAVVAAADGPLHGLTAVAFVPEITGATWAARAALPAHVPHPDAAHNVATASGLVVGLLSGDRALLAAGMHDRLHEPYRARLFPHLAPMAEAARAAGAVGACLSGAGPTVLALVTPAAAPAVRAALTRTAAVLRVPGEAILLAPIGRGAHVVGEPCRTRITADRSASVAPGPHRP